jgi:hypothetical protein
MIAQHGGKSSVRANIYNSNKVLKEQMHHLETTPFPNRRLGRVGFAGHVPFPFVGSSAAMSRDSVSSTRSHDEVTEAEMVETWLDTRRRVQRCDKVLISEARER